MNAKAIFVPTVRFVMVMLLFLPSLSGKAERGSFHLFSQEAKEAYPQLVCDFLERYLFTVDSLQQASNSGRQRMNKDNVNLHKGNLGTIRQLTPETPFTLKMTDNLVYEAIWTDERQKEIFHISFPVSFELIVGKTKHQLEKLFKDRLLTVSAQHTPDSVPENSRFLRIDDGYYIPATVHQLEIPELNTRTYFQLPSDSCQYQPVFSPEQKLYSAVNLLQGVISGTERYKLQITQNLYDFKKAEYSISLSQWLNYCKEMNISSYIGIEEELQEGIKILLIAYAHELGFHHMLSITLPWDFTETKNTVIKGKLNAYIPVHNVMTLYQEIIRNTQNLNN